MVCERWSRNCHGVHLWYGLRVVLAGHPPLGPFRLGLVAGTVCLICWSLIMHPHVRVTHDGLHIVNPLTRVWVPWASLSEVRHPSGGGLVIYARSDRVVHVWAFNSSLLDMGRTELAREAISQARESSADSGSTEAEAVRKWAVPWKAALVCTVLSVGLCYAAYVASSNLSGAQA